MSNRNSMISAIFASEAFVHAVPQRLAENVDMVVEFVVTDDNKPGLVLMVDENMIDTFMTQVGTAVPVMRSACGGLLDLQDVQVEYRPINQATLEIK